MLDYSSLISSTIEMSIFLIAPNEHLEREFLALYEDYHHADERDWCEAASDALSNFADYVRRLKDEDIGIGLTSDWVPTSHFWLMKQGSLIGTLRIRHYLTPAVEERAGHIGYDIAPSARSQGYGHLILALGLDEAARIGVCDVLAICDENNAPSKKILEKAGGVVTKTKNGEIWYILKS